MMITVIIIIIFIIFIIIIIIIIFVCRLTWVKSKCLLVAYEDTLS